MSIQNRNGRALEYAYLCAFEAQVVPHRHVIITQNSSYHVAKSSWGETPLEIQEVFRQSAAAGVFKVLEAEPLITEHSNDILEIKIQPDRTGSIGDVRDILLVREGMQWEIGISVKNNHFAVKHSRLSSKLDFGDKWFGAKCSQQYWDDIKPIFDYLAKCKAEQLKWSDLPAKEEDVYRPLIAAFIAEIKRSYKIHGQDLARGMVEYLLGRFDFYKAIGMNNNMITRVQAFNLRGTLSRPGKTQKAKWIVHVAMLPKRVICAGFKPDSNNTAEVFLDNGWQFSFRIHNASTMVETSLKFDIQIVGMPTTLVTMDSPWSYN